MAISSGTFLGVFLFAIAVVVSGLEYHDIVMDAYNPRMQGEATGSPHPILFIPPEEIYDDRPRYIGHPF